ncbi:MAG: sigma-70 family RNA polymerase sigma factor [Betaproteobacteria bacterium]|nr:MAG: sigma-70 family RNA polymerase sigma factor [Betaproteobacteria bacterium]
MKSSTKIGGGPWNVDQELVTRARNGDITAFELLVVKYQRRVAAQIRGLVRRADVVEELTQEVFLDAYDHLNDLREGVAFWAWISAIARNTASGYLRRRQHRVDAKSEPGETQDDPGQLQFAASAEQEVIAQQLFAAIDEAIAELPAKQRDALMLREIDGLNYKAIAATVGTPVNTVRSLIYRARESIAKKVRPHLTATRARRW